MANVYYQSDIDACTARCGTILRDVTMAWSVCLSNMTVTLWILPNGLICHLAQGLEGSGPCARWRLSSCLDCYIQLCQSVQSHPGLIDAQFSFELKHTLNNSWCDREYNSVKIQRKSYHVRYKVPLHCVSKKVPTFKLSATLSNLNRFSKFLHCWKAYEICYGTKPVQHYPLHFRHVATLPWEIKSSNFLQMWKKMQTNCIFNCLLTLFRPVPLGRGPAYSGPMLWGLL